MWIVLAVCWYRRLGLSYRDVEELLSERGVEVDQVTIYRWVLRFTPLLATPLGHAATPSVSLAGGRDRCEGGWPVALRLRAIDQFGPVLVVNRVRDAEEGLTRANGLPYALGGSVFAKRRGLELARRMRSGMTAVNSVLSFAAMPSLPYGGVGDSRFGRMSGEDGLREFARSKAITARRAPSLLPVWTFERDPAATARRVVTIMRLLYGRSWRPQPQDALEEE